MAVDAIKVSESVLPSAGRLSALFVKRNSGILLPIVVFFNSSLFSSTSYMSIADDQISRLLDQFGAKTLELVVGYRARFL